jgi:hypothetical protein
LEKPNDSLARLINTFLRLKPITEIRSRFQNGFCSGSNVELMSKIQDTTILDKEPKIFFCHTILRTARIVL